jgi:catalase-peroxidase
VPFTPGRVDATQEHDRRRVLRLLEPRADGFRNYYGAGNYLSPADMLVDKADLLT